MPESQFCRSVTYPASAARVVWSRSASSARAGKSTWLVWQKVRIRAASSSPTTDMPSWSETSRKGRNHERAVVDLAFKLDLLLIGEDVIEQAGVVLRGVLHGLDWPGLVDLGRDRVGGGQ